MIRLVLTLAAFLTVASSIADEQREISNTATISKTFEIKLESNSGMCQATAAVDYFQRGVEAQVETSIDTEDCDVAKGNYVVKLTIRADGDKEAQVLNFEESWERTDGTPVESMRRYPIGDDVDLVRVKIRKLTCTCTDQSAENDAGN